MKRKYAKLVSLERHFCLSSILLWSFLTASAQKQVGGAVKVMPKIIPEHDFSLRTGDKMKISIERIGSLLIEMECRTVIEDKNFG
jgi:hypothetical protein